MKRKQQRQSLGGPLWRHKTLYRSEECSPESADGLFKKQALLLEFVNNVELQVCGPGPFQRLLLTHDGTCWVLELQRDEEEEDQQ